MPKTIENACPNPPKFDPKSMPKLIQNQCTNGTRDACGKHRKTCFPEEYKHANSSEGASNLKVLPGGCADGEII